MMESVFFLYLCALKEDSIRTVGRFEVVPTVNLH